jgi:hypothetical protein
MKTNAYILLLFSLLSSVLTNAQPTKTYNSTAARKSFYEAQVKKYHSEAIKEIWNSDQKNTFDSYVDARDEAGIINEFSTVIHELLHGYNNTDSKGHTYFIEPGVKITVPTDAYYTSSDIDKMVPKARRDSILRYSLYVSGKTVFNSMGLKIDTGTKEGEVMSCSMGIFGMVEELDAYYYGALCAYEQLPYFQDAYGKENAEGLEAYTEELAGETVAFYEFRLFIGWYLLYAKIHKPEVYKKTYENNALRVAFTLLYNKYKDLVQKANERIESLKSFTGPNPLATVKFDGSEQDMIEFLEYSGWPAEYLYRTETKTVNGTTKKIKVLILDEEELAEAKQEYMEVIKEFKEATNGDFMALFFGNYSAQNEYLERLYNAEAAAEINNFMIPGVTVKNWQQYAR